MRRRTFLKNTVLGTGALSAAFSLSRSLSRGQAAPSERIRAGFVGVAGRAGALLKQFSAQPEVEVVALAEIDPRRVPAAMKMLESRKLKAPVVHTDFRKLLDDRSIDILVVGTPDHWHAIPTIMGCQAGKDVYVEKPDGHNMIEGQRMVQAMRKHKRIVQHGTQARSSPRMHEAIDYVRSGALGKVLVAKAWETTKQGPIGSPPDSQPPPGVDYDFWLGPAPKRPFNPRRFHGSWRWFFDYGSGDLGNDGVHRMDYARWALNAAVETEGQSLPVLPHKISALGGKWYFDDMQEWPDTMQVNYEFAGSNGQPGRILTYEMRVWSPYPMLGKGEGAALFGDRGYLVIGNSQWGAYDPKGKLLVEGKAPRDATVHIRNFLACVKSRKRPNADLETVGHPSSILCHAGNVAWRIGRQVELDPDTELFVDDAEANAHRTRPEYRAPWKLPEV
jgi:predicted dehydrogenase